jgi:2-haloacid dehalogenase
MGDMPAPPLAGVAAVAFDAYGTLFDVASAASAARDALGDRWAPLAETWRSRQLQYTWLRSLMGRHADFRRVTGDALEYALESLGIADVALRDRLMGLYDRLAPFPEAATVLARLRAAGVKTAILSNGSPDMLASAAGNAGIAGLLDAVLSVEEVGVYKPHPSVYRLAVERLGEAKEKIGFVSANGWDAFGAKAFGLRVAWCNRGGQPKERIPLAPDAEIRDLSGLPALLGLVG